MTAAKRKALAVERLMAFLEPYAKAYPNITLGRALKLECEAIENQARELPPSAAPCLLSVRVKNLTGRSFVIAHIPTGRWLMEFRREADAEEFVRRAAHLDWTFYPPQTDPPPATLRDAWPIFQAVRMGLFREKRRRKQSVVVQPHEPPGQEIQIGHSGKV